MNLDSVFRNNMEAVQLIENATFIKSTFGINFSMALFKNVDNLDKNILMRSLKEKLRYSDRLVSLNDNFVFVVFPYSPVSAANGAVSRTLKEDQFKLLKAVSVEVDPETDIEGNILILLSLAFKNDLGDLT